MNILNISFNNICGIGTTLSKSINRYTTHQCRAVSITPDPFGNDMDIIITNNHHQMDDLINESDLLHLSSWYFKGCTLHHPMVIFKNTPLSLMKTIDKIYKKNENFWFHWYMTHINKIKKKNTLLHYHGSDVRIEMSQKNIKHIRKNKFKILVSIPDILPYFDNAEWLPIPVPTDDDMLKPKSKKDDSIIKIVHSPTNRAGKKTDALIRAVDLLKKEFDVELMLLEKVPYKKCLELKKEAHISFDNIGYGSYAGSSIEAMCFEQPSLVYLNKVTLNEISKASDLECPLINVGGENQPNTQHLNKIMKGKANNIITAEDVSSIYLRLHELIEDDALRKEIGKKGRKWVKTVHDEKVVVEKLINIYESINR